MFNIFWPFKLLYGLLEGLWSLLVLGSCLLTLLVFIGTGDAHYSLNLAGKDGNHAWLWSLSSHFLAQYLAIQLLALGLLTLSLLLRKIRQKNGMKMVDFLGLVFLMFFAGLNLAQIAPYYGSPQSAAMRSEVAASPAKSGQQSVTLMHMNLFGYLNRNHQLAKEAIQQVDPDILALVEYTTPWRQELERGGLLKRYPYKHVATRGDLGLYSKKPLKDPRILYADPKAPSPNQTNVLVKFNMGKEPVSLLLAHPASPIQPSHLQWQRVSFDRWIKDRPKLGENLLIVGDLNTTPWAAEFKRLVVGTGLRDSQLGFGLQPSWPTFCPMPGAKHTPTRWALPFRIPIDHVLVSERIVIHSRQLGPFIGSDHLPVVVELGLEPRSTSTENLPKT